MKTNDVSLLYPQVSKISGQSPEQAKVKPQEAAEFKKVFESELDRSQIKQPLKISAHAAQRLSERKIELDSGMMEKVNSAIDKAAVKGVEDTLILTPEAALIVNVKNRTVVTAMDRMNLNGNVFTNIDGAVIV